jgi:FHA domain-containing protein/type VI secretion system protein
MMMTTSTVHDVADLPGRFESSRAGRLTLTATAFENAPPAAAIAHVFDAAGGTIGRAPGNALVLPDEKKTVSRVHARVDRSEGAWVLTDLGSNPSVVNGRPLAGVRRARLDAGDVLEIGGYRLDVTIGDETVCAARFDAPLGVHDGLGSASPASPAFEAPDAALPHDMPSFDAHSILGDPLAQAAVLANAPARDAQFDPLGLGLAGGLPAAAQRPVPGAVAFAGSERDHASPEHFAFAAPAPAMQPSSASGAIPDDYDPLSDVQHAAPAMREPVSASAPRALPAEPALDATLAALIEGLGLDASAVRDRSGPEFARLAGRMLRAAAQGVVGVMLARSVMKREARLDTTILVQRGNNPLKFFPDGDSALKQMLASAGTGYLPPQQAFDEAFDDLRAHELALAAGMRAAMQHLLARFDPQALAEAPGESARGWTAAFAMRRKARQWDRYTALFETLSRAGADDLQALCGSAFKDAYERHAAVTAPAASFDFNLTQRDDNVLE